MNYPLKNSPFSSSRNDRNRYKKPAQIAGAVVILCVILKLLLPGTVDSFFAAIFAPLWRMEGAVSADDFFATHASLVAQNAELEDELADLAPAQSSVALLTQENAELKSLLGRTVPGFTLAAVLETPPLSAYDSLVIDLGSDTNVKIGDRVYALASPFIAGDTSSSSSTASVISSASSTAPGTSVATSTPGSGPDSDYVLAPIGTVAETDVGSSKVTLFSSPGQKYPVEIGPDHISAEAVAQGGGIFDAELAQGSNVNLGDPVTIPGIETMSFGSVGSIVNVPTHPYISVLFTEPVNPYQLRWVLVADAPAVPIKTASR